MCKKNQGGREVRYISEFKRCRLKIKGGREVRSCRFVWFTSSNFEECVKKTREVGRLGSNPNPNDVISKSREVGRFARFVSFGSHLQILMSV